MEKIKKINKQIKKMNSTNPVLDEFISICRLEFSELLDEFSQQMYENPNIVPGSDWTGPASNLVEVLKEELDDWINTDLYSNT